MTILIPNTATSLTGLPMGFLTFLYRLHVRFTPWQRELIEERRRQLDESHQGRYPSYEEILSDWGQINLPSWIRDQRNQMTGPACNSKFVKGMLGSGAPGVMLDLEDSVAFDNWQRISEGHEYIQRALAGEYDPPVVAGEQGTIIFTRVRGLHMGQAGIFTGETEELVSASLFDVALVCYQLTLDKLRHPPCFYIPKTDRSAEGKWWSQVFQTIEEELHWPEGSIKCMALVESHCLAHELDLFICNLRRYLIGLNLGRYDYLASFGDHLLGDPNYVIPDVPIPHDLPWFQAVRPLVVEACHRRGIFAIGGMTARFPDKADAELDVTALAVLEKDKRNEADKGFDGAWTGHPRQNDIATAQFPFPNQLDRRHFDIGCPNLRPLATGIGQITLEGSHEAARTAIRYFGRWLIGEGATLIDGHMEDRATFRIRLVMLAQRLRHGHLTTQQLTSIFSEELERIGTFLDVPSEVLQRARNLCEQLVINEEFDPV